MVILLDWTIFLNKASNYEKRYTVCQLKLFESLNCTWQLCNVCKSENRCQQVRQNNIY
jgi:hypothetical protein